MKTIPQTFESGRRTPRLTVRTATVRPTLPKLETGYHWEVAKTADLTDYGRELLHYAIADLRQEDPGTDLVPSPYAIRLAQEEGYDGSGTVTVQPIWTLTPEAITEAAKQALKVLRTEQQRRLANLEQKRRDAEAEQVLLGIYPRSA